MPTHRTLIAIATTALAALATITPTATASSSISGLRVTNGDLVVDKTAAVTFSGVNDPDSTSSSVQIDANPDGLPCAASADLNDERAAEHFGERLLDRGTFTDLVSGWAPKRAGNYTLCAWLYAPYFHVTYASAALPIVVRQPITSLSLRLSGTRFGVGSSVRLQIDAYAEVERWYRVEVNRASVPCGSSAATNDEVTTWVSLDRALGQTGSVIENVTTPASAEVFHLCGYVGTDELDPTPTTVVDGPQFATGPRPNCRIGRAPGRRSGSIEVSCDGLTEAVTVTARRGSRTFTVKAPIPSGRVRIPARDLGLRHGRRVTITVTGSDGRLLGRRIVRMS